MEEINFEEAMKKLEQITAELEKGDLSLDESVKKFEEGIKLSKECNKILEHIKKDSYIIALDLKGKNYTSTQFSEKIQNLSLITSHITFLIGGTLGMTDELLANAKELICFSKMTFPHPLIRLFLLEQLFRGFKIMNGENYHH